MSTLSFCAQFNVDSPATSRVILIPMETILYTCENAHTAEKHQFWKNGCQTPQVMILDHFYTIPQM